MLKNNIKKYYPQAPMFDIYNNGKDIENIDKQKAENVIANKTREIPLSMIEKYIDPKKGITLDKLFTYNPHQVTPEVMMKATLFKTESRKHHTNYTIDNWTGCIDMHIDAKNIADENHVFDIQTSKFKMKINEYGNIMIKPLRIKIKKHNRKVVQTPFKQMWQNYKLEPFYEIITNQIIEYTEDAIKQMIKKHKEFRNLDLTNVPIEIEYKNFDRIMTNEKETHFTRMQYKHPSVQEKAKAVHPSNQ